MQRSPFGAVAVCSKIAFGDKHRTPLRRIQAQWDLFMKKKFEISGAVRASFRGWPHIPAEPLRARRSPGIPGVQVFSVEFIGRSEVVAEQ